MLFVHYYTYHIELMFQEARRVLGKKLRPNTASHYLRGNHTEQEVPAEEGLCFVKTLTENILVSA